jgi:hypothetical protein
MSRQSLSRVSPSTSTPTSLMEVLIKDPNIPAPPSIVLNREVRNRSTPESHYWEAYEQSLKRDHYFVATINRRLYHVGGVNDLGRSTDSTLNL